MIVSILTLIASAAFLYAGVTGATQPFGDFVPNNILVRIVEVLIGLAVLFNFKRD